MNKTSLQDNTKQTLVYVSELHNKWNSCDSLVFRRRQVRKESFLFQ